MEDHVHLLARFGSMIARSEWVKELKRVSHDWLERQGGNLAAFAWQGGNAAFSVSHSNLDRVREYIQTQAVHHGRMTFQDELRTLLRKHRAEWDERYVWDLRQH